MPGLQANIAATYPKGAFPGVGLFAYRPWQLSYYQVCLTVPLVG
jgi:hypothetical protein